MIHSRYKSKGLECLRDHPRLVSRWQQGGSMVPPRRLSPEDPGWLRGPDTPLHSLLRATYFLVLLRSLEIHFPYQNIVKSLELRLISSLEAWRPGCHRLGLVSRKQ